MHWRLSLRVYRCGVSILGAVLVAGIAPSYATASAESGEARYEPNRQIETWWQQWALNGECSQPDCATPASTAEFKLSQETPHPDGSALEPQRDRTLNRDEEGRLTEALQPPTLTSPAVREALFDRSWGAAALEPNREPLLKYEGTLQAQATPNLPAPPVNPQPDPNRDRGTVG